MAQIKVKDGKHRRESRHPKVESGWFEQCYIEHGKRIRTYFFRITGDSQLSADLTQDVFLRVHKYGASFQLTKGTFVAWLFRIARNVANSYFRTNKLGEVVDTEAVERLPDEIEISDRVSHQEVNAAIDILPRAERDVLLLRKFQCLSVEETARKLNLSKRTVDRRLAAGLIALKGILVERGLV